MPATGTRLLVVSNARSTERNRAAVCEDLRFGDDAGEEPRLNDS